MTRLLRVELIRLLSRRAVLVLIVAAIALPALILVARVIETRPPAAGELQQAEAQAAQAAEKPWAQRQLNGCLANPEDWGFDPSTEDVETECEQVALPTARDYVYWEPLDMVAEREEGSGLAVVVVLAVLMMLAGSTFAGHDWANGSVSNQLLFEPRRTRVWVAKAAVVTVLAGLVAIMSVTAFWLLLGLVARSRDIPLDDGLLLDCLQSGWRGAGVAAAAALAAYALTMLFRSTVAALGVLLVASLAGGLVVAVIGVDSIWNPGLNIAAVILDGVSYGAACDEADPDCSTEGLLSIGQALRFLGSGLVLFAGTSVMSFQRRDVP